MSFLRMVVSVLATQVLVAPVVLLTGIVLARGLPVDDRGFYAVAFEFATIAVVAIHLGWAPTAIYRLRRSLVPPPRVAAAALWVTVVMSAIAIGACLILREPIRARLFAEADPSLLPIALAAIPFQLAGLVFTGVARGLGDFHLHNGYRLGSAILLLVGITCAIQIESRASSALVGTLVAHAIAGTVLVALVLRHSGLELRIPFREIGSSLRFGTQSYVQEVLTTLHQRLDILLLAWLASDPEAVAVYAVAVSVINRVRTIPMSIALAMFPTIAGQEADVADRFVARVSRNALFSVLVTVVLLAVTAPLLVPLLFGERYTPAVLPLLVLLPAAACLSPALVLSRYFTARAQQHQVIAILLVSLGLNVTLNLVWIPRYGTLGAAGASVASYGLQFALMLVAFTRESGQSFREALILGRSDWAAYRERIASWRRRRAGGARRRER